MQTISACDDDIDAVTEYGVWRNLDNTRKRRANLRLVLEATGVVAVLALLSCVIALSVRLRDIQSTAAIFPECMHALGGGPVGPGGSLHPFTPEKCVQQLHVYAHNAYWQEVELAAQDAMSGFGFNTMKLQRRVQPSTASSRSSGEWWWPVVLQQGLPRSLLSILEASSWQHMQPKRMSSHSIAPASARLGGPHLTAGGTAAMIAAPLPRMAAPRPTAAESSMTDKQQQKYLVVFDIDETLLSNMPQILDPETWPWDKWVSAAQAAPLRPMLALYQQLCSHGYAIALVTGRREPSRNHTMTNLERAGYGKPCVSNSTGTGSSSSSSVGDAKACCYDALMMRPENDTRLASVYKPWARQQLLVTGTYQLVALLGDQYSDLNGEGIAEGVQAYKLPNPFYFIL